MESSLRILIVEDESGEAGFIKQRLQQFSPQTEITAIHSAETDLKKISGESYSAIIYTHQESFGKTEKFIENLGEINVITPVIILTEAEKEIAWPENRRIKIVRKAGDYLQELPEIVQETIESCRLQDNRLDVETKYQTIFDHADDLLFLVNFVDFRILEANRKSVELLNRTKEELAGKKLSNIFPEKLRTRSASLLQQTLKNGEARDDSFYLFGDDGEAIPVEVRHRMIPLQANHVILTTVRIITEKKVLQSLILNSKRRLQNTFDGIQDVIYQVNQNYELVIANRKFAENCSSLPKDLIGEKCYGVYFQRKKPCEDCPAKKSFSTHQSGMIVQQRGERINEVWAYPIFDEGKEVETVTIYSKDVTEKKSLEKRLIQSEKLSTIGLLASGIAHEIRNPLNIIDTARYYIDEFLSEKSPDIANKLQMIQNNVQRASKIIHNLLEFSRYSDSNKELVNLSELVESTVALIKKELVAKNIVFSFTNSGKEDIFFSKDSLKQALLNIFMNAVQAMPNGGTLAVSVCESLPDWVDIKISDTGGGISEANLATIFSPFFTTKDVGEGTGLGLYITHMVLSREGGKIGVESEEGKGTIFTISIPVNN